MMMAMTMFSCTMAVVVGWEAEAWGGESGRVLMGRRDTEGRRVSSLLEGVVLFERERRIRM